jgi:hypothetical protein
MDKSKGRNEVEITPKMVRAGLEFLRDEGVPMPLLKTEWVGVSRGRGPGRAKPGAANPWRRSLNVGMVRHSGLAANGRG